MMSLITDKIIDKGIDYITTLGSNKLYEYKIDKLTNINYLVAIVFIKSLEVTKEGTKQEYEILYQPTEEELVEQLNDILGDLKINDVEDIIDNNKIVDNIIKKIKEQNIVTVIGKSGDEYDEDLYSFFSIVRKNFIINLKKIVIKYPELNSLVLINNSKYTKERLDTIIELLLEIKNMNRDVVEKDYKERKDILLTSKKNNETRYFKILDLSKHYDKYGKNIKDNEDDTIKDEINEFVNGVDTAEKYNIYLNLFYGASYYLGQQMHDKLGNLDFKLLQRGVQDINWNEDNSLDEEYKLFSQGEKEYGSGKDIVLYIGVGSNNIDEVKRFLNESNILYKELIKFNLDDKNSNSCVKNGTHASQLAEQVMKVLREKKYDIKHIFYRGPVSITFYMGKKSFGIHNVIFYKYIDDEQDGTYTKEMFIK